MTQRSDENLKPRDGHTLIMGIVARISGCASQKEASLEDQVDHAKEEVAELYEGPIEYRIISTKGKGEQLDRPELAEIEAMLRTRELDLLVMEDVGRLVRGPEAARLWGIAVDHGTRCIAPNDCCDTADDNWEEDLLEACAAHVGHNAHTSKRLKKKLMNRFRKYGACTPCPPFGYVKPPDTKTYDDWRKVDSATPIIRAGAARLMETLNCSAVADWFNQQGVSLGEYCRRKEWNGPMVRRLYRNPLLKGSPGRGFRHTEKRFEKGHRVSVPNPKGPIFWECPHLAHLEPLEFDELNARLDAKNDKYHRKLVNGTDPRWQVSRKRTRFPGQHACCWYCGHQYVWGGNGVSENLMCAGSRQWHCWNSFGFDGRLAVERLVSAIVAELEKLDGFEEQFAHMVRQAREDRSGGVAEDWRRLLRDEAELAKAKDNLGQALRELGARPFIAEQLNDIERQEKDLAGQRRRLEHLKTKSLRLPDSTGDLRQQLQDKFQELATDSPEFGDLMRLLVPEFHVYLVRLLDGGHPLPRAKVTLALAGIVPDAQLVPGLGGLLNRELSLDLFEQPPQRERIREEAVRLAASGLTQRQIAARLSERPKLPAVQKALALDQTMRQSGLNSPYVVVTEPPEDYSKLKRHRNSKYAFQPREGYQQPII